jgi:hypothetical protein
VVGGDHGPGARGIAGTAAPDGRFWLTVRSSRVRTEGQAEVIGLPAGGASLSGRSTQRL